MHRPLVLLLILGLPGLAAGLDNQLRDHPSPYLAMHGDDPVAWQDWGPEVLQLARAQGKLILVSSGYFSCHWCHVMQRESYRDKAIAGLLNEHYIPVKLDRELHGALDGFLIDFLEQTQGQAGWPLNIFLTPEGYPLIGATYLPPEQFAELLRRLQASWRDERRNLRNLARRTSLQLQLQGAAQDVEPLAPADLRRALREEALALADPLAGGFGDQSRFPMAPQLSALLELQAADPHPQLAEFLGLTLDRMAGEGLRDHLAGGFFRYTVDPSWEVPHFEKMLYTQAQLAEVYLRAAEVLRRDDFAEVARDTLAFVAREMCAPGGACVASFSAVDSAGEEGGVYLWSIDELHALLGEQDTALARRHWRMLDLAAFDGGHLPRRGEPADRIAAALDASQADIERRLAAIRVRLLQARAERGLPVDDKQLAGWNGLTLAAFARAAQRWEDPALHAAAYAIRDYIRDRLWDGSALRRAVADGRAIGRASLADYAYVAYGMQAFARLSGDPADRTFVAVLLNLAWQRFHEPGGWRMDDAPLLPGMGVETAMVEGALPAPSALLIRLTLAFEDPQLVARARGAAEQGRNKAQQAPFWYTGHHAALLQLAAMPR